MLENYWRNLTVVQRINLVARFQSMMVKIQKKKKYVSPPSANNRANEPTHWIR